LYPSGFGFRQHGKQVPDGVGYLGIGGVIAPVSPIDGLLVDIDDLVQVGQAGDLFMFFQAQLGIVQFHGQGRVQNLVDEGGFSRPGHTCYRHQQPQGQLHHHLPEIIFPCLYNRNPFSRFQ